MVFKLDSQSKDDDPIFLGAYSDNSIGSLSLNLIYILKLLTFSACILLPSSFHGGDHYKRLLLVL